MKKRIADRRIYGHNHRGHRVLVAAPGQPIPEGFDEETGSLVTTSASRESEASAAELDEMTVPQLRELAAERGIGVDDKAKKAELIEALS
jgi:hypothetical protein